jgi:hypothetical protein
LAVSNWQEQAAEVSVIIFFIANPPILARFSAGSPPESIKAPPSEVECGAKKNRPHPLNLLTVKRDVISGF